MLHQRRRAHRCASVGQFRQEIVTRECRPLGCELLISAIRFAGNRDRFLQLALIESPRAKNSADVLVRNLSFELGVGTGCGPDRRSWTVSTPNSTKYPSNQIAV